MGRGAKCEKKDQQDTGLCCVHVEYFKLYIYISTFNRL